MKKNNNRTEALYAYAFNGGWKAEFSFESYQIKEERKRRYYGKVYGRKEEEETYAAIDVLRRRRVSNDQRGTKNNWFRTLAARIRLNNMEVILPGSDKILLLEFEDTAPVISAMLDYPADHEGKPEQINDWSFIPVALQVAVIIEKGLKWPEFISKAEIRNLKTNRSYSVTPGTLLKNYFGLTSPGVGNGLLFDPDGLTLNGAKNVPWEEGQELEGLFRYRFDQHGDHLLEIEKNPLWINSLRSYQHRVIEATAHREDDDGLPEVDSPGVGLVASEIPDKVFWQLIDGQWVFKPDPRMFEGEIRSAAGTTSRLRFDEVMILDYGKEIRCISGQSAESKAQLKYDFSSGSESQWSGSFDATLDRDSRELLKSLMQQYGLDQNDDLVWIQTASGALQLPLSFNTDDGQENEMPVTRSNSIFKGLIRFSEVPWVKSSDKLPPTPDISGIRYASIIIENADRIEVGFQFEAGSAFACSTVHVNMDEPVLRLEDYLPVYLPPRNGNHIFNDQPPDLPLPVDNVEAQDQFSHFLGLSLIRGKGYEAKANNTSFGVQVSYQPGIADKKNLKEGNWKDSHTVVHIPEHRLADVQYWYRPPGLHWIPGLPLYGDPAGGERLNQKRTYLLLNAAFPAEIALKPGVNWQVPVLMSGKFTMPVMASEHLKYPIFNWVIPELPGIALELVAGEIISIANGIPEAGKLNWVWRHDLPVLDEINALRVSEEDQQEKENAAKPVGKKWTDRLTAIYALSQLADSLLMRTTVSFKKEVVLSVSEKKIKVENLFAGQELPGFASLKIVPPQASLRLEAGEEKVNAIGEEDLLKGISASFDMLYDEVKQQFRLIPASTKAAVRVEAGTMMPVKYKLGKQFVTLDQQGRGSFRINDDRKGRQVLVTEKKGQPLQKAWLWSHHRLDLSTAVSEMAFCFSNLPLVLADNHWVYRPNNDLIRSAHLRNFRWGSIDDSRYWGLPFQHCRLLEISFEEGEDLPPSIPVKVVFEGILHQRPAVVGLADELTQGIQVTYLREGTSWKLDKFEGHVLWPFYEPTPDLSETDNVADPMPWLASPVSIDSIGNLVFGNENEPATACFRFMQRTWKLPVRSADGAVSSILADDHVFTFDLIEEHAPPQSTLVPASGTFFLKRKGVTKSSRLTFNISVAHDSNTNRSLLDVVFDYSFTRGKDQLSLQQAAIFSFDENNHLVNISKSQQGEVEISPGKLSLAINKDVGWRKNRPDFELLPGWRISDEETLQTYLSLEIAAPPSAGEVNNAQLEHLHIVMETAVTTPNIVAALITYTLNNGQPAQLEIELTGMISLTNDISWTTGEDKEYHHELDILLRQAKLKGSQLEAMGAAFFRPRYVPSSNSNAHITGMTELPCLARHRLLKKENTVAEPVMQWVAPQNIRLCHPRSLIEEVLLRGGVDVKLAIPEVKEEVKNRYRHHKSSEFSILFEAAEQVEAGFVGELGEELEKLLKNEQDMMLIEATEAFWLRSPDQNMGRRSAVHLWKKNALVVDGIPTFDTDFDDSGKTAAQPWTRLAMPFITDTHDVIRSGKSGRLNELLSNLPESFEDKPSKSTTINIPRESLLSLRALDQYALDHQPAGVKMGQGMDQVVFDPSAYERLFPYTSGQSGFEPGWLSFNEWQLNEEKERTNGIPFGATVDAIDVLKSSGPAFLAVTEVVPKINGLPGDQDFEMNCYYITSPLAEIAINPVPVHLGSQLLRLLGNTPRIFYGWQGIGKHSLGYVPPSVREELLEWANLLSSEELKSKVPDAPGGFSETEEGYGIGELVVGRIRKRVAEQGPFTALEQLLEIKGFGIDKLSDFIYAVAKTQFDFSFENQKFEELRISIQFWLPAKSTDAGAILAQEKVFLLGITNEDSWQTVLFAPEDTTGRSKVRKRIWDWVASEGERLNVNKTPLLRARILTQSALLEEKYYCLIPSRSAGGAVRKTRRMEFNTSRALFTDPRFEPLAGDRHSEALASGPELLDGEVYYEPRNWYEPLAPVLDNKAWKGIISEFEVSPKKINRGEAVTLKWNYGSEGTLELTDREGQVIEFTGTDEVTLKPQQTTVYVLTLKDASGEVLDRLEAFVIVRVPAAGNAVGFTHKIAGVAPGPLNGARQLPGLTAGNYHNWLEMTRDVVFEDITRPGGGSELEPGALLPASRKISFNSPEMDVSNLNPFLVPRTGHIFTSGRPGAMMRFRLATLSQGADDVVHRGGSWAYEYRFPRPVPLPEELYPFDADYVPPMEETARPTCSVESLAGPQPFSYYGLAWQDPIFNRRLHAVAQEQVQGALYLSIDRPVYGGKDVCYPEVQLLEDVANWRVQLEIKVRRTVNFQPETVEKAVFEITHNKVVHLDMPAKNMQSTCRQPDSRRYVFEMGIGQPEAADDNFIAEIENEDQLVVTAVLYINNDERNRIELTGLIRTDKDSWSQPQNAYGVIRKTLKDNEVILSDIAAFGWVPKPKIVKRRDRFRAGSWEGTFRYKDAFVQPPQTTVAYEVISITSYGEQKIKL